MLKGVIFDMDGTLIDTLSHSFEAFNHGFTQYGAKRHTPQEILAYFGPSEGDIFSRVVGVENGKKAYQAFRQYMDEHVTEMPIHSGIEELLAVLEENKIPFSIFTGRSWDTTEIILRHHGLLERFVTIVTSSHVGLSKPSPEGLYLALSRMKLEPSEVLFVGDSPSDLQVAHAAGSTGVAALWDVMAKREDLAPHRPHHWAETPMAVWEIFQQRS